jgi:hypothetical protein
MMTAAAVALGAPPAGPQPAAPAARPAALKEPSAAARELARLLVEVAPGHAQLSPQLGKMAEDMGRTLFIGPIQAELLRTDVIYGMRNCDPAIPACREAAHAAATEMAEAMLTFGRARAELASAYAIAQRMDETQIAATLAFLRSPAGMAFHEARRDMALPASVNWEADLIAKAVREKLPDPTIKMRRDYLERIKDLPAREVGIAPPASPAPLVPKPTG